MAAVAGLEGDLVGTTVWGFEPGLQESSQVLHHVILKGLARSSYLDEEKTRIRHGGNMDLDILLIVMKGLKKNKKLDASHFNTLTHY